MYDITRLHREQKWIPTLPQTFFCIFSDAVFYCIHARAGKRGAFYFAKTKSWEHHTALQVVLYGEKTLGDSGVVHIMSLSFDHIQLKTR